MNLENKNGCNDRVTRFCFRRDFLKKLAKSSIIYGGIPFLYPPQNTFGKSKTPESLNYKRADFWHKIDGTQNVQCTLCPHNEILKPNQTGLCRVRKNSGGELVTLGYNQPCIMNIDPIGKNPLYHFYPDISVLSIAHAGCNLRCNYCQNWQFAFKSPEQTRNVEEFYQEKTIEKIIQREIKGVSFTYTEPACCPEFIIEFANRCKKQDIKTTICTSGYIHKKPMKEIIRAFDAVTVTFKGATQKFYKEITGSDISTIMDTMVEVKSRGTWLEVATLILPSVNDSTQSLRFMAQWIRNNLGENTPWIIEKFEPQYKLKNLPPTSQKTIDKALEIGYDSGLKFVYVSNLAPHEANHTYCPNCKEVLVKRLGFKVINNSIVNGKCPSCQTGIPGSWA